MTRWINRAAFVVRPRQPFIEWRGRLDGGQIPTEIEANEREVSIYLVREDKTGREETPPLEDYFARIFETELEAWCADPTLWPEERTMKLFQEWFEVAGESTLVDLEDSDIEVEEL